MSRLDGVRAIVTGGASGMGAATVRAFARAGAAVASFDVNDDAGRETVDEAARLGAADVSFWHCDVSSDKQLRAAFAAACNRLGGLEVLVNCAGVELPKPPESCTEADLDRMMAVHMKGTMFTNQLAFEQMRQVGGSIVNFGSGAGVRGAPDSPVYAAAKGAVLAWTRSVARAWGRYGIRVNAVCPMIATPMLDSYLRTISGEQRAAHEAWIARSIPLGGAFGSADLDLAPVVVFLAADASRFITGQTIAVDGGLLMLT